MSESSMCRGRPSSPALAAPLPDNDDILREIFLRLPPFPSSLPRASLVCKRWRRLLSDPRFLRRFRAFHHRQAPLLGFFIAYSGGPYFIPTLEPPDRIPSARLSLDAPYHKAWTFLCCRHGLTLILNRTDLEITVCDPVTGDQRCSAIPPGFKRHDPRLVKCKGALLCDDHASRVPLEAFKVALLWTDGLQLDTDLQIILVKNSLYWLLHGFGNNGLIGVVELDLDSKNLAVIDTPAHALSSFHAQILRMEDSRLGLAISSELSIQAWERKANFEGGARWMLQKTIELDKLLPLGPDIVMVSWTSVKIYGYDEDGNAIIVSPGHEFFMIQLKSLQFRKLFESTNITVYHPYKSFFTGVSSLSFTVSHCCNRFHMLKLE
ncbi:hypothetical protein HU200_067802 [Digitaria exilis]|uniref:F-box domain-containing protein n=1 Tax=Digitaria exilis TaxID=1010633 RepID=A0A834ZYY4_9POAL|nr:hypothetical protein HU200_067802 [Digitaria exilis]